MNNNKNNGSSSNNNDASHSNNNNAIVEPPPILPSNSTTYSTDETDNDGLIIQSANGNNNDLTNGIRKNQHQVMEQFHAVVNDDEFVNHAQNSNDNNRILEDSGENDDNDNGTRKISSHSQHSRGASFISSSSETNSYEAHQQQQQQGQQYSNNQGEGDSDALMNDLNQHNQQQHSGGTMEDQFEVNYDYQQQYHRSENNHHQQQHHGRGGRPPSRSPPTRSPNESRGINYHHQQQHHHHQHQQQQQQQFHNPHQQQQHQHHRIDSDDLYNAMKNNRHHIIHNAPIPKFYESDADTENGSIIYNTALHRRLDSMGSTGSYYHYGSSPRNNQIHTNQQQQQQQRQYMNEFNNSHQPHHQQHHTKSNTNPSSSRRGGGGGNNNGGVLPYHKRKNLQNDEEQYDHDNNNNNSKNNGQFRNRPAELSTISASYRKDPNTGSPPQYHAYSNNSNNNHTSSASSNHNQLPPMHGSNPAPQHSQQRNRLAGYQRDRTYSDGSNYYSPKSELDSPPNFFAQKKQHRQHSNHHDNHHNKQQPPLHPRNPRWNRHEYSHNNNDEGHTSPPKQKVMPTLHIRAESTGSISSLGSLTGGASTISRRNAKGLSSRLGTDIDQYLDDEGNFGHNIIEDDNHGNYGDNLNNGSGHGHRSIGRQGSGFLSSILGSISMTSAGSVNSLESEKKEFHQQNQKFLKRAERDKAKKMKMLHNNVDSGRRLLPDLTVVGQSTMRSVSPGARSQRSHRPKLPSIDNDDWEEDNERNRKALSRAYTSGRNSRSKKQAAQGYGAMNQRESVRGKSREQKSKKDPHLDTTMKLSNMKEDNLFSESGSESDESCYSSDFTSNQKDDDSSVYIEDVASSSENISFDEDSQSEEENERTSLLQPHGISTGEISTPSSPQRKRRHQPPKKSPGKRGYPDNKARRNRSLKTGKKNRHVYRKRPADYRYSHRYSKYYTESSDNTDSSSSSYEDQLYLGDIPARERKKLLKQWKLEFFEQQQMMKKQEEEQYCHNRFKRWISATVQSICSWMRARNAEFVNFVSNLPLTIGAIALAIVTLGIVWFKFAEQMMSTCQPVHYHSSSCTFSEFPGCMSCDTSSQLYQVALKFHLACSFMAGLISLLIITKILVARKLFIDEMNSPTTASPAGLLCTTLVCVFAGKGQIGQVMVTFASTIHFCIAVWFIYMVGAYNLLPDPSWYPNTVGIGITASKMWLYHPIPGHLLMMTSLSLYTLFFPFSLVRVSLNKKLSASVTWMQMSAPAAALSSLTIMGQPSFQEEYPDITLIERLHRMLYLPAMHVVFVTAILGVISSVQSLVSRWDSFSRKPFSPAHAAFCFPTLAHANAIQNYRSAILSFSMLQSNAIFMRVLDIYWIFFLINGTIATVIITTMFFFRLPSWTKVDVEDEIEPPAPNETIMSEVILAGQTLRQDFVSPAVLQANEAGALVRVPGREGEGARYARTRRVTALGFEPIMNLIELNEERDALLDWVAKNPPRQRKRTLSVPGITRNIGNFGSGNRGVYTGGMSEIGSAQRRARAQTSDWNYRYI